MLALNRIQMDDVHYVVDSYIVRNGFHHSSNETKKELIETGMKKYLIEKMAELKGLEQIIDTEDVTLHDLAESIEEIIPEEQKDAMSQLTHYLLGITGFMQGYYITWYVEDNKDLIEYPSIEYREDGKIDKLVTHRETSYTKTFDKALETLEEVVEKKNQRDKQYRKSLKQIS